MDSTEARSISAAPADAPARASVLAAVLCYAYGTQVFDSYEVQHACGSDPHFRRLAHGMALYARDLVDFRRHSRGRLVTLLGRLLARSVRHHFGLGASSLATPLKHRLHQHAVEWLDIARHMDTSAWE